jgi:integrase
MKPPTLDEQPVEIIFDKHLVSLFKACRGTDFSCRRDLTMFRLLLHTGVRIGEGTGMKVDDLELEHQQVFVIGQRRQSQESSDRPKIPMVTMRYLGVRVSTPTPPALWLGIRGPLIDNGINQILRKRCREAGIRQLHPHQFRHTFSHKVQDARRE